jgi:hypothetical protein
LSYPAGDDSPDGIEVDNPFVIQFAAFVNPPGVPPSITIVNPTNTQVATTPPAIAIDAVTTKTNTASCYVFFSRRNLSGTAIVAV